MRGRFDAQLSVYNRLYDAESGRDAWHRTVVQGASWQGGRGVKAGAAGYNAAGAFTVRVPEEALCGYLAPHAWRARGGVGAWTVQSGDVVLLGAAGPDIQKAGDITGVYENSFVVAAVRDNRRGRALGHLRVEGG